MYKNLLAKVKQNSNDSEALYELALLGLSPFVKSPITFDIAIKCLHKAARLDNPRALFHLAQNYRYGQHGKNINKDLADVYLKKAAECGSESAVQVLQRETATVKIKLIFQRNTEQYQANAHNIFTKRYGLEAAIRTNIFPAIVSVVTADGINGTGYFQHSNWLVSNAHVFSSATSLQNARVMDTQQSASLLDVERSFHRPSHFTAPDISVVKVNSRINDNNICIPTFYQEGAGGYGHTPELLFYVYFSQKTQNFEIKFVDSCINNRELPQQFPCANDEIPEPGCSGAPLIGARVITSKTPEWTFETKGVVYARCNANNKKHLLAIPVDSDFQHLLQGLRSEDNAERAAQMSYAADIIKDQDQKQTYEAQRQQNISTAQSHFKTYGEGVTELYIILPEGIEKLYYRKRIIKIEESLLLEKNQKALFSNNCIKRDEYSRFAYNIKKPVELIQDYNALLAELAKIPVIDFSQGKGETFITSTYFRVDFEGLNDTGDYFFKLQDNTGNFHIKGEPSSSDLAIAKFPKSLKTSTGYELAKLLRESQESSQEKKYILPVNTKKPK